MSGIMSVRISAVVIMSATLTGRITMALMAAIFTMMIVGIRTITIAMIVIDMAQTEPQEHTTDQSNRKVYVVVSLGAAADGQRSDQEGRDKQSFGFHDFVSFAEFH
jgi:hypothetical protein